MARSTPVILHSYRRAPDGTVSVPYGAERLAPLCESRPKRCESTRPG